MCQSEDAENAPERIQNDIGSPSFGLAGVLLSGCSLGLLVLCRCSMVAMNDGCVVGQESG